MFSEPPWGGAVWHGIGAEPELDPGGFSTVPLQGINTVSSEEGEEGGFGGSVSLVKWDRSAERALAIMSLGFFPFAISVFLFSLC